MKVIASLGSQLQYTKKILYQETITPKTEHRIILRMNKTFFWLTCCSNHVTEFKGVVSNNVEMQLDDRRLYDPRVLAREKTSIP